MTVDRPNNPNTVKTNFVWNLRDSIKLPSTSILTTSALWNNSPENITALSNFLNLNLDRKSSVMSSGFIHIAVKAFCSSFLKLKEEATLDGLPAKKEYSGSKPIRVRL